jgi:transcriptional regulator NrdR family protein
VVLLGVVLRKCPQCGKQSFVIQTRDTLTTVYRRRECRFCKVRWSTWESTSNIEAIEQITNDVSDVIVKLNKIVNKGVVLMPSRIADFNGEGEE